ISRASSQVPSPRPQRISKSNGFNATTESNAAILSSERYENRNRGTRQRPYNLCCGALKNVRYFGGCGANANSHGSHHGTHTRVIVVVYETNSKSMKPPNSMHCPD